MLEDARFHVFFYSPACLLIVCPLNKSFLFRWLFIYSLFMPRKFNPNSWVGLIVSTFWRWLFLFYG